MNREFWRGKKVLITGHTGFKGSWLSLWLQECGADLAGFALEPPTNPSLFDVANVKGGMKHFVGDVRDLSALTALFHEFQPEIVIHMAAQALVRDSYKNPVETYATNVMGTVHVLEAVRCTDSVRVVVNVTSDKCYENKEWVWGYREIEPMGGYDPYSNSKGCSELVTAAYRNSFFHPDKYDDHGVAVATARAGNVIGGGDWAADRLIPDIMRSIAAGQPVIIRSPLAIRPWQHVLEPLSGYLLLAQKLWEQGAMFADSWNFGPNDEDAKSVSWIVEQLTYAWGDGASWVVDKGDHPHEATYLKLDCSKAKGCLNWYPRWVLSKTLDSIVDWHRSFHLSANIRNKVIEQIQMYEDARIDVK